MLFAVPSSAVNSAMDYYAKMLALGFREKLTKHLHNKYLQKMFYYKVSLKFIYLFIIDMQLGFQNTKSRSETHSGFGQVVHQFGQPLP